VNPSQPDLVNLLWLILLKAGALK